jgi:hypothetical protein
MKNILILIGCAVLAVVIGSALITPNGGVGSSSTTRSIITAAGFITEGDLSAAGDVIVGLFTEGGAVVTVTPVTATVTLTEANLLAGNVITFTASSTQEALTVTLPATSTLTTFLPTAGDMRRIVIENPFTGAATTTTIAAGTGIDLQEPDGQNVVIGITDFAWLTCFRKANTDVVCLVDESIPAD